MSTMPRTVGGKDKEGLANLVLKQLFDALQQAVHEHKEDALIIFFSEVAFDEESYAERVENACAGAANEEFNTVLLKVFNDTGVDFGRACKGSPGNHCCPA
jgi:hypothetical protein